MNRRDILKLAGLLPFGDLFTNLADSATEDEEQKLLSAVTKQDSRFEILSIACHAPVRLLVPDSARVWDIAASTESLTELVVRRPVKPMAGPSANILLRLMLGAGRYAYWCAAPGQGFCRAMVAELRPHTGRPLVALTLIGEGLGDGAIPIAATAD